MSIQPKFEIESAWLVARNSAATGIHSDEFAQRQGFKRAVVAGPNHLSFAANLFETTLGEEWLANGRITARFTAPVYDGDELQVTCTPLESPSPEFAQWETRNRDGTLVARGSAGWTKDAENARPAAESSPAHDLQDLRAISSGDRVPGETVVPRAEAVDAYTRLNHDALARSGRVPTAYLTFLLFSPARRFLDSAGVGPGMWGEIDIRQFQPLIVDEEYRYTGTVLSVRARGRLELIDFEFEAHAKDGSLACSITHSHIIPHRDTEVPPSARSS